MWIDLLKAVVGGNAGISLALLLLGGLALASGVGSLRERVPALARIPLLSKIPALRVPFFGRRS